MPKSSPGIVNVGATLARERSQRTSLAKIASEAGVSAQTVSRVMSGHASVAPATRKRIEEIAKARNYRRNLLVSGILKGQTKTVGVIASLEGRYYPQVITGIHDELAANSYGMLLSCDTDPVITPDFEKQLIHIHRLVERRVDGIILRLADDAAPENYLREIELAQIPVVMIDRSFPHRREHFHFVSSQNFEGAREAANLAIQHGHRLAGYLGAHSTVVSSMERCAGLRQAFVDNNLTVNLVEVYAENWNFPKEYALSLLQRTPRPTVLFCVSDDAAPSIYEAARLLKLRIPEDLSVVGFGNLQLAINPPLTSVEQFPKEVGRTAARLLLDDLSAKKKISPIVCRVETRLVERQSLGPAPERSHVP